MNKIPFVDGTKTQEAYVPISGQNYEVVPAVWTGPVPMSAFNLNKMQDNIEEAINVQRASVTLSSTVNANTNYTLPVYYEVGNNSLEVFYCGSKLEKGTDYNEIGNTGDVSNTIQFLDSVGDLDMSGVEGFEDFEEILEFVVRGEYNAS